MGELGHMGEQEGMCNMGCRMGQGDMAGRRGCEGTQGHEGTHKMKFGVQMMLFFISRLQ